MTVLLDPLTHSICVIILKLEINNAIGIDTAGQRFNAHVFHLSSRICVESKHTSCAYVPPKVVFMVKFVRRKTNLLRIDK